VTPQLWEAPEWPSLVLKQHGGNMNGQRTTTISMTLVHTAQELWTRESIQEGCPVLGHAEIATSLKLLKIPETTNWQPNPQQLPPMSQRSSLMTSVETPPLLAELVPVDLEPMKCRRIPGVRSHIRTLQLPIMLRQLSLFQRTLMDEHISTDEMLLPQVD
jgi:hypothetical protein